MTVTFDKKLAELDAYLQMLIEQTETLDKKIEISNGEPEKENLVKVKNNLESLLSSIKHAIVLLQIAKVSITSPPEQQQPQRSPQAPRETYPTTFSVNSNNNSIAIDTTAAITASLQEQQRQLLADQHSLVSPQPPIRASKRQQSSIRRQLQGQLSLSSQSPPPATRNFIPQRTLGSAQPVVVDQQKSTLQQKKQQQPILSSLPLSLQAQQQSEQIEATDHLSLSLPHCDNSGLSPGGSVSSPSNLANAFEISTKKQSDPDSSLKDGATTSHDLESPEDNYEDEEEEDDDDFYDAADEQQQASTHKLKISDPLNETQSIDIMSNNNNNNNTIMNHPNDDVSIDWDSLYEDEEEDLGSLENHGSVIKHLMSQIRIGMDLTKVVLPTFILERRSLLEMYADFFAHPDLFSSIPDYESPEERMVQIVRWYLSAFHAGRRSSVAKKPYNPILGEIFLCHWNLNPGFNNQSQEDNEQQPIERTNSTESTNSVSDIERFSKQLPKNSLLFVAEQVSHHPPVSAFYAENAEKLISCCAHIYTKSKYLGLSVGVHNIGQGVINVLKHNETYVVTFPSAYGRSILTVPWVELGGSVNISCEQTGYSANIEFVTKPFYGGKKHRVMGEILRPNKEPLMSIDGEWNGCMYSKSPPNSNDKQVFVDTACLPVIKKNVRSISSQESFESRNVWKEVTRALKLHDVTSATAAKSYIEQRQRDLLKDRMEKGNKWKTRYFETVDDGWTYAKPLAERLAEAEGKQ